MKIIFYDSEKNVVESIENISNPVVDGDNVTWEGGSLTGAGLPFLLLDDDVNVEGGEITDDLIKLDKKEQCRKKSNDLEEENKRLKERLICTEDAILTILNLL